MGTRKIKSVNSGWEKRCLGKRRFQRGNSRLGMRGRKEEIREEEIREEEEEGMEGMIPGKRRIPEGLGMFGKTGRGWSWEGIWKSQISILVHGKSISYSGKIPSHPSPSPGTFPVNLELGNPGMGSMGTG